MTITSETEHMPQAAPKKRVRRDTDQLVADLQAKIEALQARAARKRVKAGPAVRHLLGALRSMDKATSASEDQVLRKTLEEARGTLSAYLSLQGIVPAAKPGQRGRRSSADVEQSGASLANYVIKNPGQRGEDIAAALGTDTKTMRLPMKQLIADKKVRTKGERRGMRYYPV
jgi:hypothetical protein